jgi:hypothetical protein
MMKYNLLSTLNEAQNPIRGAVKALEKIHRDVSSGKSLPKGFVPFKELEKLIQLEDKFQDAEDMDGGPNIEGGNADIVYEEGMEAAAKVSQKYKGQILDVENNGVFNEDQIRFIISIVGKRISQKEAESTIQKYLIPLLGDVEFSAFGKAKFVSSRRRYDDVMFPVDAINFDVILPIL